MTKYTLTLQFQEEAVACCPVSSPRTTCPYLRITPSLVFEPRPLHPYTLPASTLKGADSDQHKAVNLCGVYIFLNEVHFTVFFVIKSQELKLNGGPSS